MPHLIVGAGSALLLAALVAPPALATPPGRNGLIVWQREADASPPRLWAANPDGSGARQIFGGPRRQADFEGTFSTTDPNVVFFSRGVFPFRPFREDLFRGDLSTGTVTRVRSAGTADIAAAVSPDGTRLAYFAVTRARLAEDAPPPPQRIHVAGIDGSAPRAVSRRAVRSPSPAWRSVGCWCWRSG